MLYWLWMLIACHHGPNLHRVKPLADCRSQENTGMLEPVYQQLLESQDSPNQTGVLMLEEGLEALLLRGWLASQAQQSIDIQYFIFSADNVGLISTEALVSAAERGVKVRLMVDDVLAHGDEMVLRDIDMHPNIEVKVYNPNINIGKNFSQKSVNMLTQFEAINQRMHHKTFLVDGRVVITGGRNVGEEYYDLDSDYNFRDRDVALFGGVVGAVEEGFELFWTDPHSVNIASLLPETTLESAQQTWANLHHYACEPTHFVSEFRTRMANMPQTLKQYQDNRHFDWIESVQYISDAPWKNETQGLEGGSITTRELLSLLSQANSRIWIETPYLVLSEVGLSALKSAIDRGVEIKILTNSLAATDNYPAFAGYQKIRKALLEMGVDLYEMRPDAVDIQAMNTTGIPDKMDADVGLHAKSMLIDHHISVVGTFNMDPRSANLNTESLVVIRDEQINQHMEAQFSMDMSPQNAWVADSNNELEASIVRRVLTWVSRLVPQALL